MKIYFNKRSHQLTNKDVSTAIHQVKYRHDEAATRIIEIAAGATQRAIDFSMDKITAEELKADAAELVMLRQVAQEVHLEAL